MGWVGHTVGTRPLMSFTNIHTTRLRSDRHLSRSLNHMLCSPGNATETANVDENTHEFFTELTESGTYRVQVTAVSSSGDCEARESAADTGFTFYLSTYMMKAAVLMMVQIHAGPGPGPGPGLCVDYKPVRVRSRSQRRAAGGTPRASTGSQCQTAGLQHRRRLLGSVHRGPQRQPGVSGVDDLPPPEPQPEDGEHVLWRGNQGDGVSSASCWALWLEDQIKTFFPVASGELDE